MAQNGWTIWGLTSGRQFRTVIAVTTSPESPMKLKFLKELPMMTRGPGVRAPWRAELMKHPGLWAAVKKLSKKTHGPGGYRNVPGFEFAVRTIDGAQWIFARYIGNGKP
jgi:hypothetical protein